MVNILDAFTIDAVMQDVRVKPDEWCIVAVKKEATANAQFKNFIIGRFNEEGYLAGRDIVQIDCDLKSELYSTEGATRTESVTKKTTVKLKIYNLKAQMLVGTRFYKAWQDNYGQRLESMEESLNLELQHSGQSMLGLYRDYDHA